MKRILIVGADSAIVGETAKLFAASQAQLYLTGLNTDKLDSLAQDLRVRGASKVTTAKFDALEFSSHAQMLKNALASLGDLDVALIGYGSLPDQKRCEALYENAEKEFKLNCLSVISLLTLISNKMEEARKGCIAVISSPAGDRGRQSNYVYGAAKGALSIFLSGLRNRLSAKGVHVLTVKPGFVSTPMTAHLKQGPLYVGPEKVGKDIFRAIQKGKNILYTPWFWQYIMFIIKHIPEFLFKKLKL